MLHLSQAALELDQDGSFAFCSELPERDQTALTIHD
jgi:hypothetical protein